MAEFCIFGDPLGHFLKYKYTNTAFGGSRASFGPAPRDVTHPSPGQQLSSGSPADRSRRVTVSAFLWRLKLLGLGTGLVLTFGHFPVFPFWSTTQMPREKTRKKKK